MIDMKFEMPIAEVIALSVADIITTSTTDPTETTRDNNFSPPSEDEW